MKTNHDRFLDIFGLQRMDFNFKNVKKSKTLKVGKIGPNQAPAGCDHDLNRSYRELMNSEPCNVHLQDIAKSRVNSLVVSLNQKPLTFDKPISFVKVQNKSYFSLLCMKHPFLETTLRAEVSLYGMAFSFYEVVRVACLLHWVNEPTT